MQKNGTGEHIPPPRPKRKSSQPYPQKANSSGTVGSHGGGSSKGGGDVSKAAKKGGKGSSAGVSTGGMGSMAPSHEANMGRHGSPGAMGAPPPVGSVMHSGGMSSMGMNGGGYPMATSVRPSWDAPGNTMRGPHPAGPGPMSSMGGDGYGMGGMVGTGDGGIPRMMGGSNSHGSTRREGQMLMGGGMNGNGMNPGSNQMGQYNAVGPLGLKGFVTSNGVNGGGGAGGGYGGQVRGNLTPSPAHNPDFVVVYTFLAGLFDPKVKDHAEDLNAMSHIDRETTTLLMRNLSSNLMCPRMWEDQIQLIGRGCPTFVNATYDEKGVVSVNVPSGTVLHGGGIGRSGDDDEDGSGDGGGSGTGVDVSGALKGSAGRHEEIQIRGVGGSHGTNKHGYVHAQFTQLQPHPVVDVGTWSDQYVGNGPMSDEYDDAHDHGVKVFDKGGRSRSHSGSPTEGTPEDIYITGGA